MVQRFEKVSGAILSRNKKCKVIGLGNWASKEDWPLVWIKTVKYEKVFGIFVCNNYDEMLRLNWDHRYKKFSNVLYSWSSRVLDTLQQRVEQNILCCCYIAASCRCVAANCRECAATCPEVPLNCRYVAANCS